MHTTLLLLIVHHRRIQLSFSQSALAPLATPPLVTPLVEQRSHTHPCALTTLYSPHLHHLPSDHRPNQSNYPLFHLSSPVGILGGPAGAQSGDEGGLGYTAQVWPVLRYARDPTRAQNLVCRAHPHPRRRLHRRARATLRVHQWRAVTPV
jgi:hypothetical protein